MPTKDLNVDNLGLGEDWVGNNAAFRCPLCQKVFLVSQFLHQGGRRCPKCAKSIGRVTGGSGQGGDR